jgi:hypothetical protein
MMPIPADMACPPYPGFVFSVTLASVTRLVRNLLTITVSEAAPVMKPPLPFLGLAVLTLLHTGLAAQAARAPSAAAAASTAPKTATSEVVAARPDAGGVPAAGSNTRTMISSEVRASLRDAAPQFEAPKPPMPPPAAAEESGPNNEIVRLPAVTVQEERPPVFKTEELYSRRDQAAMALRKFAGLNVTPFAWLNRLNAPIAVAMMQEEIRLQKMQDVSDTAAAFRNAGDKDTSDYIMKSSNATFLRAPDFGRLKKQ